MDDSAVEEGIWRIIIPVRCTLTRLDNGVVVCFKATLEHETLPRFSWGFDSLLAQRTSIFFNSRIERIDTLFYYQEIRFSVVISREMILFFIIRGLIGLTLSLLLINFCNLVWHMTVVIVRFSLLSLSDCHELIYKLIFVFCCFKKGL